MWQREGDEAKSPRFLGEPPGRPQAREKGRLGDNKYKIQYAYGPPRAEEWPRPGRVEGDEGAVTIQEQEIMKRMPKKPRLWVRQA